MPLTPLPSVSLSDDVSSSHSTSAPTPSAKSSSTKIRAQLTSISSKLMSRVNLATLRPLPEFLGTSATTFCIDARAFTPPAQHADNTAPEKIRNRLSLNLSYFASNYFGIFISVSVIIGLSHPVMLFWLSVISMGWWAHAKSLKGVGLEK